MNIIIDGRKLSAEAGETILQVARRNGIDIPTLCHHEALEGVGACRLCIVEITHPGWKGATNHVTSCLYPVEDGLEVQTKSPSVIRRRRTVLGLLAARCPESEVIRRLADDIGGVEDYERSKDGSKCVMCYLCTRACAAVGANAISAVNRGTLKEIAPPFHEKPESCVGCGTCARICPTGHIAMTDSATTRRIWDREFELVLCKDCGAAVMTAAHRELAVKRGPLAAEYFDTCPVCKRRGLAGRFARVGS